MTTVLQRRRARPVEVEPPEQQQFLDLDNVSWELYERLRRETDEAGSHVRITYDEGRLVLMSPLPIHELVKKLTARLIEMTAVELNIPCSALGSTTWKRKDLKKGLEADECYYVQHEAQVRGKKRWNLKRDPPPDLAVEVDITHQPIDRPSIYGALGVNEVWRFDGERMHFLKRGNGKRYHSIAVSEAFPMLTPEIINAWLDKLNEPASQTTVMRQFRNWLRTLPEAK